MEEQRWKQKARRGRNEKRSTRRKWWERERARERERGMAEQNLLPYALTASQERNVCVCPSWVMHDEAIASRYFQLYSCYPSISLHMPLSYCVLIPLSSFFNHIQSHFFALRLAPSAHLLCSTHVMHNFSTPLGARTRLAQSLTTIPYIPIHINPFAFVPKLTFRPTTFAGFIFAFFLINFCRNILTFVLILEP